MIGFQVFPSFCEYRSKSCVDKKKMNESQVINMTPGATPTHTYNLPISSDDIVALRITYEQNGKILFQKEKDDCELIDKMVIVKLEQEDTLQFDSNTISRIQLKARTTDGTVYISDVIKKPTNIVLDKEVI